ncbi:MAG TPA: cupredoxin domain-containing protein [Solirubrobacteraceae bacterium]
MAQVSGTVVPRRRVILVRRVQALLAVVALLAAAGVGVATAASKTRTVKVTDRAYEPRKLTVRSGTKVVWSFNGSLPHNVEVTRGPELFSSSIYKKGTFSRRMRKRGTYRIVCTLHTYMTMRVVVR